MKTLLLMIIFVPALLAADVPSPQSSAITGVIIDKKTGETIIGATIQIKGTTTGASTDIYGAFSIKASEGSVLIISFVGYRTEEITIGTNKVLKIQMEEDLTALDEVVIVGYGVQKKANLSGAVASIPMKALENRPVLTVGQALQGAVANLTVTIPSGQAHTTPSYNIRGMTSINGGEPLIVIDGIISNAETLNRLNPTDIASSSVLKDASSAAIYGSRAAFGVILITTKRGKSGKLVINYNNNVVFRTRTNTPDIITDPYQSFWIKQQTSTYGFSDDQLRIAQEVSEGLREPFWMNPDGTYTYYGSTDWVKETYKDTGFATSHNLSFSGATENINYYFSSSYDFQDGMIKYGEETYNRYNLRSKLEFKINDWWTVGNNTSFIHSDYKSPENIDDLYREIYRLSGLSVPKNPDGSWTNSGAYILGRLESGGKSEENDIDLSTIFDTRISLIKDVLSVTGRFSYKIERETGESYSLPIAYSDGKNQFFHNSGQTFADIERRNNQHTIFDVFANFNKSFNKHDLSSVVGFSQEDYKQDEHEFKRTNLITSSLPTIELATGDMTMGQEISTWAVRGVFARLNYTYDNKYIFEFNGRYDGTSKFRKDSRFVFSPSGSAAWVISQEDFFEPITDVVSFFKARYSYGVLGNQDVGDYAYAATMDSGKTDQILDGVQPMYVGAPGLVTPGLTWEKVSTSNIGADLGFLDGRFNITGEYYVRKTTDMLTGGTKLPNVLGTGVPEQNTGDLETKGWEITAGWRDNVTVAGKTLTYEIGFNIGDSRSWITKYNNPIGDLGDQFPDEDDKLIYYEGQEIGEMWGLTTFGFFQSEEDIKNSANHDEVKSNDVPTLAPGDLKFVDSNGDGKINKGQWTVDDPGDYSIIGNSSKRYTYGITGNVQWNGIDLSVFLQGVGSQNYYPHGDDLYFWGVYEQPWTNATVHNFNDRWDPDTNPDGYFPRLKAYEAEDNGLGAAAIQTRYMQNAGYLRLKNLTVGYTFPKIWTEKMQLSSLRVFFSGDNLATFSRLYENFVDPEGVGEWSYPMQRYFSFGLNVAF